MGGPNKPLRVAIVGGGCASVAAAFELTRPEHQGCYQVTMYQLGWRLGGKGASGRGPGARIEEHGLHLWMGWYENAFRLVRECYAELERDPRTCPIADWRDAFAPASDIAVTDRTPGGDWVPWTRTFPPAQGLPGDPPTDVHRFSARGYVLRTISLLRGLLAGLETRVPTLRTRAGGAGAPAPGRERRQSLADNLTALLRYGEIATLTGMVHGIGLLESFVRSLPEPGGASDPADAAGTDTTSQNLLLRLLDTVTVNSRRLLEERLENDLELRRVWEVIDLALATLRGNLRFGLLTDPRGFDVIDEFDCREWLLLNGASEHSVRSGYMNGLYDLGFSYEGGDTSRPRVSAAQALRGFMRSFFTYRGAFFWKMQAGMGDVVFAPFYEVLKRRGVRFEFFHRLRNMTLADPAPTRSGDTPHVATLEFDVQAHIRNDGEYAPLVHIDGLPCWPSAPDFRQLVDGARLKHEGWDFESHWDERRVGTKTLRVVDDFDFVVLGVGLGAIPHVCPDLVARDPRWSEMVKHVKTVATQAFQIWLKTDMTSLGWPGPAVTLSGFETPFDTWADMRHLLPRESWARSPCSPRALAYFCSVLPDESLAGLRDADYAAAARERVRLGAIEFLDRRIVRLWPNAARAGGGFRWELLVAPSLNGRADSLEGPQRFASQFWTANVNPSDRYTLALPGSSKYRISPLDSTYDNLTIAGDWTDCGFNSGCVEAAVMSGRLAAHAISKRPRLEDIIGFDHP